MNLHIIFRNKNLDTQNSVQKNKIPKIYEHYNTIKMKNKCQFPGLYMDLYNSY